MPVRIQDRFISSGALLWLFYKVWDTVELPLKISFIYIFAQAVIDPTILPI